MTEPRARASSLVRLLRDRHAQDLLAFEVKDGPTHTARHRRLDAWAMLCTWSPVTLIGYEIKVSRSDFRADDKWREYLPLCTRFFFVTPAGLLRPEEVESPAGLLEATKKGDRLRTVKPAGRLEFKPEAVAWLTLYLLMSQAKIVGAPQYGRASRDREAFARGYLATREERRRLGRTKALELALESRERRQEPWSEIVREAATGRIGPWTAEKARRLMRELGEAVPEEEAARG